jgi:hypothetical protein
MKSKSEVKNQQRKKTKAWYLLCEDNLLLYKERKSQKQHLAKKKKTGR